MNYDANDDIPEGGFDAGGEENNPDIQELLDIGYDQLDGFRTWVEEGLGLGVRIAEQDGFNAEFLIDYLANHQRKGVIDINEFELRWFIFSHYIRKAMADEETETRLPESLQRFFGFLRKEHQELVPAWVSGVLDDTAFFANRRRAYAALDAENERAWEAGFRVWCDELEDDLDTRCLWLPRDFGDGMEWKDVRAWREATLYAEANENWQRERERLLRQGHDFESARAQLMDSYYGWLDTPQAKLDEQTPREVVQAEHLEQEEQQDDQGGSDGEDE